MSERKLTENQEKEICELYKKEKLSSIFISKKFNVCPQTIINILRRNKIEIMNRGKNIVINENYFTNIDTKEKAYWLGLFYADGSIGYNKVKNSYIIQMSLQYQDKHILELFLKDIESDSKIYEFSQKVPSGKINKYVSIHLHSKIIYEDLKKWGCMEHKTYLLKTMPVLNDDFLIHFLRGFYDGDGCTSFSRKDSCYFGFCGTFEFMDNLRNYLYKEKITLNFPSLVKDRSVYRISYKRKSDILSFYTVIYKNCENHYLKRKKEKFDQYYLSNKANTEVIFQPKN